MTLTELLYPAPSGLLGPNDRLATDDEVAATIAALADPNLHAEHFMLAERGAVLSETVQQYLSVAMAQVGYRSPANDNQHSKFNDWFASVTHEPQMVRAAWCAMGQCYCGQSGAIPANLRSAGALALLHNFPATGSRAGALTGFDGHYYPSGHIEVEVKPDPDPSYQWDVGFNTSGGTGGAIGVYYCRRYLPGNLAGRSWPHYGSAPSPAPAPAPITAPAFPLPPGWYFGPKAGPTQSVSGYFNHTADLARWQQRMANRGWTIGVDGHYGDQTEDVAKMFQSQVRRPVTGLIDAATWSAAWTAPVTR